MDRLNQSKRRDKKIYITDIAIDKVPYIKYDGFTDERNQIMQELAKDVLVLSKEKTIVMRLLLHVILMHKIHLVVLVSHLVQSMKWIYLQIHFPIILLYPQVLQQW